MSLAPPPGILVPPAHLWQPPALSSAYEDGMGLLEAVGRATDPEQELALQSMYAERPDGRWSSFEVCLICARQNLKSYTFECAALIDLFIMAQPLVIWSAHLFSTAMEAFRNLKALCENHRVLSKRVKRITTGNGEEGIELLNGCRLLFRARSKTGGRGLSGDVVFLDEALFLTATEVGSLLPVMAARPNPQVRYGSSAGVATSAVLRGLRDRGRKGGDPSLTYLEWCAHGSFASPGCQLDPCDHRIDRPGCVMDDRRLWAQANPAMIRGRIDPERIAAFRRTMTPAEFAREFLTWWDDPAGTAETAISRDAWLARADVTSYPTDPITIALDVTPRGTAASVAIAGWRPARMDAERVDLTTGEIIPATRRKHLEVIAAEDGTGWVLDYLEERVATWKPVCVAVDGSSPAAALIPQLRARGIEVTVLGARDMAAACGLLDQGIREDTLRHNGGAELAAAVEGAIARPLAGGWAFARLTSEANISPLVAATVAGWALEAQEPETEHVPASPRGITGPGDTSNAALEELLASAQAQRAARLARGGQPGHVPGRGPAPASGSGGRGGIDPMSARF